MEPPDASVMVEEVEALAGDLRDLAAPFDEQARDALTAADARSVSQAYLVGDGDSYHASCAAELAFETIADVVCRPMSAERFVDYGADWMRDAPTGRALVVATSASGRTPRVVQALERARERGALTIALTGTPGSAATEVAERSISVEVPGRRRSPAIRTYQASLVGMLLLAIRLGELRGTHDRSAADDLRSELAGTADLLAATCEAVEEPCRLLAAAIADAPAAVMLGSGPSYGTALFASAKVVEACGILAVGQDVEEWWHVERFARPLDMPVFVIAPPGRSHWRAVEIAAAAAGLGRRVVAVTHETDREVAGHAVATLPVRGDVREELSPLLYHPFSSYLAAFLSERLGRTPFQSESARSPRS